MALLAKQRITRAGLTPAYTAASGGGDTFAPGPTTLLHVKNGGGGSVTVTVTTPKTTALGQAIADDTRAIAAGAEAFMGPYPAGSYANPSTRVANVGYSGVTSVTVALLDVVTP